MMRSINVFDGNGKNLGALETMLNNPALREQFFEMLEGVIFDTSGTTLDPKHYMLLGYSSPLFCLNAKSDINFRISVTAVATALRKDDYATVRLILDKAESMIMEAETLQRNNQSIH